LRQFGQPVGIIPLQEGGSVMKVKNSFTPLSKRNDFVRTLRVAFLLFVGGSPAVLANDLPKEGQFSAMVISFGGPLPKPVMIGNNKQMTVTSSTVSSVSTTPGGLLSDMAGVCVGTVVSDTVAATKDFSGYCNFQDKDGDLIFQKYETGPQGGDVTAKFEFVGGTGRYTGLRGTGQIVGTQLKSMQEGYRQGVGSLSGTYKIETPH
jgi:hypothetical protein